MLHHFFEAREILSYFLGRVLAKQRGQGGAQRPPRGIILQRDGHVCRGSPYRFEDDGTRMRNDRSFQGSPAYPLIIDFINDFRIPPSERGRDF